jgi:outer membrane protein OmpA-like peptidoglycan-associated protein
LHDGVVFTAGQVDDAGSAFQYTVNATGYKETQQFLAAGIPLQLQYHTAGAGTQWYFAGGGKVGVPFNPSIQISAQQLSLSGYYPDYNLDVSNLPQHGFGTINSWKASATTELKPTAALSAATGLSFRLSPRIRIYTGLYVDYGLTGLKEKNDSLPLVTYSSTGISGVKASSVLNRQNTGQVALLSFGLQVRLTFGSNREKPATAPKSKKGSQQPAKSTINDDDAKIIQRPIVFGTIDETSIPEIGKRQLDEVASIMMFYPGIRISIVGHICNSGTETEDIQAGVDRAKAVETYLRTKGIDRKRMDISSVSVSDPVLPNNPAANYQNRRVVISVE